MRNTVTDHFTGSLSLVEAVDLVSDIRYGTFDVLCEVLMESDFNFASTDCVKERIGELRAEVLRVEQFVNSSVCPADASFTGAIRSFSEAFDKSASEIQRSINTLALRANDNLSPVDAFDADKAALHSKLLNSLNRLRSESLRVLSFVQ